MQIFYLIPTRPNVGLTSVTLGLIRALQRQGLRVGFAKPVAQQETDIENSLHFARAICAIEAPPPLSIVQADKQLAAGEEPELLEEIISLCLRAADGTDVLLTTQYLDEAEHLADRIGILHDGRIIADGTLAELKALLPPATIEYVENQPSLEEVFLAIIGDHS